VDGMQQRLAVASVLVLVLLAGTSAVLIQSHATGQAQPNGATQSTQTSSTTSGTHTSTNSTAGSLLTNGNHNQTSDDDQYQTHMTYSNYTTHTTNTTMDE
jgi:hypothetical protein